MTEQTTGRKGRLADGPAGPPGRRPPAPEPPCPARGTWPLARRTATARGAADHTPPGASAPGPTVNPDGPASTAHGPDRAGPAAVTEPRRRPRAHAGQAPGPGHRGAGAGLRARAGRRGRGVRHPGRCHPARLRPAARLQDDPAHPGQARAGRGPRGHRVRAGHRPRRRVHGDQRPGRDQPGHAHRRRLHGLGPDGGHHRPGAVQPDRHRHLPGGRHLRDHHPDHQAQLPGHQARRHRPHHRRGVPRGLDRSAGAGAGRRSQGRACRR